MISKTPALLRVALIGGGPGGLSSAIALSKLDNVEVTVYEKAHELREIGAGISIAYNAWKVLELLEADAGVKGYIYETIQHRNGLDGTIISENKPSAAQSRYRGQRARRTRLQQALIAKVPSDVIKLNKKLVALRDLGSDGVQLRFEDGEEVEADLVIGADGIRSVVREHVFPDHATAFTGRTIWRVVIPRKLIEDIPEMTESTAWWHGPAGHFYNCLVDDPNEKPKDEQLWEIAVHNVNPSLIGVEKRFSWGIPATNERVESHFTEYDPRVRTAMSRVPDGLWKEFSSFSGPRLEKVVASGKIVLIGDASHPLTGAFGSGAAFAMQDSWILARAIDFTRGQPDATAQALEIFDAIRSPYYARMYEVHDQQSKNGLQATKDDPAQSFEKSLEVKVKSFGGGGKLDWIYGLDISASWAEFLTQHEEINSSYVAK